MKGSGNIKNRESFKSVVVDVRPLLRNIRVEFCSDTAKLDISDSKITKLTLKDHLMH